MIDPDCKPRAWDDDDRDLIERWNEGDPAAFAAIVRKYAPFVRALAIRARLDYEEIEDLTQDVWIGLLRCRIRPELGVVSLIQMITKTRIDSFWKRTIRYRHHLAELRATDGQFRGPPTSGGNGACQYCDPPRPAAVGGLCHAHHKRKIRGASEEKMRAPLGPYRRNGTENGP